MPLKGPGPGRVPDLTRVKDKSPAQLERTLERFGLEPDIREIERRARRVYEDGLERVIESGALPDRETWRALDAAVERSITDVMSTQVKSAIRDYRIGRIAGTAKHFVWITAEDKGVCASCRPRHGKRKTMREWRDSGMPGSAVLRCGARCRCQLLPDTVED
jgi:hypothetical protein